MEHLQQQPGYARVQSVACPTLHQAALQLSHSQGSLFDEAAPASAPAAAEPVKAEEPKPTAEGKEYLTSMKSPTNPSLLSHPSSSSKRRRRSKAR
jgi:hypothetical protein